MKISIVTVCYNAADSIQKTIESVLSQSYSNTEHLIIDGGSKDETPAIVNRYRNRLAYVLSEKDDGIYDAMNKGISAATGDFLYFLNSNDTFYDNSVLQKAADALRNSRPDLLIGDALYFNNAAGTSRLKTHQKLDKPFFYWSTICQQSAFYRADTFLKCGLFNTAFKITGDYDWFMRALFKYRLSVKCIAIPFAIYPLGGVSSCEQLMPIHNKEREEVICRYFNPLERRLVTSKKFSDLVRPNWIKNIAWRVLRWNVNLK